MQPTRAPSPLAPNRPSRVSSPFRLGLYLLVAGAVVTLLWMASPIPQDPAYHQFADQRSWFGIPRAMDVLSNAGFLWVGVLGLLRRSGYPERLRASLALFWSALALTGLGSAYYHLAPDDPRLFWDRLPMTLAFLAVFGAVLQDRFRWGLWVQVPLLAFGLGSLWFWKATGDLSLYILVQVLPALLLPLLCILEPRAALSCRPLAFCLLGYGLAKAAEFADRPIFEATGWLSGHTLKHLLAALGAAFLLSWGRRPSAALGPYP